MTAGRSPCPFICTAIRAWTCGGLLAEAAEQLTQPVEIAVLLGHDLDRRLADLSLQFRGRSLGDDLAVIDDPDAIGQHVRLLEVLRGQEDRDAFFPGKASDLLPERGAALWVEARGRLVEEENRRIVDQRQREIEAALHAAGVRSDLAVGGVREPDAVEQRLLKAPASVTLDAVQRRLQPEVLAARQERVERRLLECRADRRANLRPVAHDVVAGHGRAAGRGGRRVVSMCTVVDLPGAVRPQEAVDLAGLDAEIDPVDRPDVLELAHEPLDLDPTLPTATPLQAIARTSVRLVIRHVPLNPCRPLASARHIGEPIGRPERGLRAATLIHLRAQL